MELNWGDEMAKTRIEPTFWYVACEEWPQDAALRRLSDWEVDERVDDGGDVRTSERRMNS